MEIARRRQDADVARVAVGLRIAGVKVLQPARPRRLDAMRRRQPAELGRCGRGRGWPSGGRRLRGCAGRRRRPASGGVAMICRAVAFEQPRPDDDVDDAGLVLERDEDRVAVARPLADEDDAGGPRRAGRRARRRARRRSARARRRSPARERPSGGPSATGGSSGSRRRPARPAAWRGRSASGSSPSSRARGGGEQRQGVGRRPPRLPQRLRAGRARASGRRRRRRAGRARGAGSAGSAGELLDGGERARAATIAAAQASRKPVIWRRPRRSAQAVAAPAPGVLSQSLAFTSTGQHLDAVLAGVADDLRRGVEAHRLAVEQRGRRTPPGGGT